MNLPKIKHMISIGALLGFEKNALILFCFCNKYVYVKYLPILCLDFIIHSMRKGNFPGEYRKSKSGPPST